MSHNIPTELLIDGGESSSVEFISSPDSELQIAKSVAAFLNTNGGSVIVGFRESEKSAIDLTDKQASSLEKYLRKKINPSILFAVSLDETKHGSVIVIEVPKGRDRPYMIDGQIFVRHGKTIKPATSAETRRMVSEDTDRPRWERLIASGLQLDDLDRSLLKKTIDFAIAKRGMSFSEPSNQCAVLTQISMYQFGELTNAADIAFGSDVSNRHPQTRVRAVTYDTDRGGDLFTDDQLFGGPALKLYEDAMAFLRRNVTVAIEFERNQSAHSAKPTYPFNSLREGLVNAIVHRDYESYSGSVSVSVYPNRIEIWNSGHLSVPPSALRQAKHESILNNPDISNVFYLNGLMERVGRGTYNIARECKEFQMRPPKWENTGSGVRLTFYSAASVVEAADELSERMTKLLKSLKTGGSTCLFEYVQQFQSEGLSDRQARRDLLELTRLGFLERFGAARATRYKRTELKLP
jgi:ATP-dependent DNA helicase RecG